METRLQQKLRISPNNICFCHKCLLATSFKGLQLQLWQTAKAKAAQDLVKLSMCTTCAGEVFFNRIKHLRYLQVVLCCMDVNEWSAAAACSTYIFTLSLWINNSPGLKKQTVNLWFMRLRGNTTLSPSTWAASCRASPTELTWYYRGQDKAE